jgi:hypothetical protein
MFFDKVLVGETETMVHVGCVWVRAWSRIAVVAPLATCGLQAHMMYSAIKPVFELASLLPPCRWVQARREICSSSSL